MSFYYGIATLDYIEYLEPAELKAMLDKGRELSRVNALNIAQGISASLNKNGSKNLEKYLKGK